MERRGIFWYNYVILLCPFIVEQIVCKGAFAMTSNFAFLKDEFPALAEYGRLAEKYCYSDSNSCLIKLGMLGETLVALDSRL